MQWIALLTLGALFSATATADTPLLPLSGAYQTTRENPYLPGTELALVAEIDPNGFDFTGIRRLRVDYFEDSKSCLIRAFHESMNVPKDHGVLDGGIYVDAARYIKRAVGSDPLGGVVRIMAYNAPTGTENGLTLSLNGQAEHFIFDDDGNLTVPMTLRKMRNTQTEFPEKTMLTLNRDWFTDDQVYSVTGTFEEFRVECLGLAPRTPPTPTSVASEPWPTTVPVARAPRVERPAAGNGDASNPDTQDQSQPDLFRWSSQAPERTPAD